MKKNLKIQKQNTHNLLFRGRNRNCREATNKWSQKPIVGKDHIKGQENQKAKKQLSPVGIRE